MITRGRQFFYVIGGLAVGLVVAMLLSVPILVAQVRATQVHNTSKTQANTDTLVAVKGLAKQINSCVTPGRPCFKESQERTAGVLANVQQIVILAAACAVDETASQPVDRRVADVLACVTAGLAAPKP